MPDLALPLPATTGHTKRERIKAFRAKFSENGAPTVTTRAREDCNYVSDLSDGDKVIVTWHNGIQSCSLVPKDEATETAKISSRKKAVVETVEDTAPGETVTLTAKQLRKEVLAGNLVFTKTGKKIPMTKRAEKTPEKKLTCIVKLQGKIKCYHLT